MKETDEWRYKIIKIIKEEQKIIKIIKEIYRSLNKYYRDTEYYS